MNKESISLTKVDDPTLVLKPGDFHIDLGDGGKAYMTIRLPGESCGGTIRLMHVGACDMETTPRDKRVWNWDGNMNTPTIYPSINHEGCWHGWLKQGHLTSV